MDDEIIPVCKSFPSWEIDSTSSDPLSIVNTFASLLDIVSLPKLTNKFEDVNSVPESCSELETIPLPLINPTQEPEIT